MLIMIGDLLNQVLPRSTGASLIIIGWCSVMIIIGFDALLDWIANRRNDV